jgi:hypothetical protein
MTPRKLLPILDDDEDGDETEEEEEEEFLHLDKYSFLYWWAQAAIDIHIFDDHKLG